MTTWSEEQFADWQRRQVGPRKSRPVIPDDVTHNWPAPKPAVPAYVPPGGKDKASEAVPTEHAEQSEYFEWVRERALFDERYLHVFAVPNGTSASSPAEAAKMLREGRTPGVPDVLILYPKAGPGRDGRGRGWHGCALECKRAKGGQVSQEQRAWLTRLSRAGYYCQVAKGADELKEATEWYLGGDE